MVLRQRILQGIIPPSKIPQKKKKKLYIPTQQTLPNDTEMKNALGGNLFSKRDSQAFEKATDKSPAYYFLRYGFDYMCFSKDSCISWEGTAQLFGISADEAQLGAFIHLPSSLYAYTIH